MGRGIKLANETYVCPYFPIGSIYMNVADINPSTYFGGTWVKIEDAFLFGASSIHPAGETGGEETHTLTINEMPSHNHSFKGSADLSAQQYASGTARWPIRYITTATQAYLNNTGGNQAHNNMPPYLAVYIWKRTA